MSSTPEFIMTMLKTSSDAPVYLLTIMMRVQSLMTGKKVLYLLCTKKGSTSSPANYRPTSLTCISCKIMEHIVISYMNKHLAQQKII